MKYFGEEFEKDYEECEKCGTRRPKGTLCRKDEKGKLICKDSNWCELQENAVKGKHS